MIFLCRVDGNGNGQHLAVPDARARARAHLAINVGVEETEDVLELHVGLGDDERHCGFKAASQPHGPGMSLARVCSLLGGLRMRRRGPHARRLRPRAKIERVRRFARAPPFRAFSLTTFRTRTSSVPIWAVLAFFASTQSTCHPHSSSLRCRCWSPRR